MGQQCPSCKHANEATNAKCVKCGTVLFAPVQQKRVQTVNCPACTMECDSDMKSCSVCGTSLKNVPLRRCQHCTCCETPVGHSRCVACGAEMEEVKKCEMKRADAGMGATLELLLEEDRNLALAIQAEEETRHKERIAAAARGLEGVPGVGRCPRCACPLVVLPGEMNCTIFICAVARSFEHGVSTQLGQHNEAAAQQAKTAGRLVDGCCGGQFRWDGSTFVSCTGR